MTDAERELIETKLDGLGNLFEVKLKASVDAICEKVAGIERSFIDTKQTIDNHIIWHNNLNKKIAGYTFKTIFVVLCFTVVITFVIGFKEGILQLAITKMIGL